MTPHVRTGLASFAALAALVLASPGGTHAQGQGSASGGAVAPINGLPNPYETLRDFGRLPDGRKWGSVSGIHVDIDGRHIWAADRCGTNSCAGSTVNPIVKLDPNGNVVAQFGAGVFIWPHGMSVDREGNVWVTDARLATKAELEKFPGETKKGNAVHKFSPQGKLLLTIGTPGTTGDGTGPLLNEPNAVIVAPNGDIFIGESHSGQNDTATPATIARIAKFSKDGKFIKSWGKWGSGPGEFKTPHAFAFDSQGRLFVADRGNNRLQIFDTEGKFIAEWHQFNRISGLAIGKDDVLYAIDSESDPKRTPGWSKGMRIGSAKTGEVRYYIPHHDSAVPSGGGGFGAMGEGVAVDAAGNIYGGEVGSITGITKFVPRLIPR